MSPLDYRTDILQRLLNQLENRKDAASQKPLTLKPEKAYADYTDPFSEEQEQIQAAIEVLIGWGLVQGKKDDGGYYKKLSMPPEQWDAAYQQLGRVPKRKTLQAQIELVTRMMAGRGGLTARVGADFLAGLEEGKFPGFGIGQDTRKLKDILLILQNLDMLKTETYVRNFSEAVFHDSKRFQVLQNAVKSILMDYTDTAPVDPDDKDAILEQYDLYQNPSYVYFKGGWKLHLGGQVVDVQSIPGGMGLPVTALPSITKIQLIQPRLISVENLTTYHDTPDTDAAVLYLGGFPNRLRVEFLKLLYRDAPGAAYFHRGDLDPYGFLILENLISRTGIPFQSMEMDLDTLRRCYAAGHFKPLKKEDLKIMENPQLACYQEIFSFMKEHNCKIEQECFAAMQLAL